MGRISWEKEFFKIAGFMLRSRYQIMQGREILKVDKNHTKPSSNRNMMEMSMIGYIDSVEEMRLILEERKK